VMSQIRPAQFGFCVPVFAMPGPQLFRTPSYERLDPQVSMAAAVECDRLGYDSLWVADHFFLAGDGAILEGWTTLCVLAGMTNQIKLGSIHLCTGFRNPTLLAKMAATLDVLSNGRLLFFADGGNRSVEFDAYDFPWHADSRVRNTRMREALELILQMWQEDGPVTFAGSYYKAREALCLPHPVQRPHPPIWLGETPDEVMLKATAELAAGWNTTPVSTTELRERLAKVEAACTAVGRPLSDLELSLETQILIAPTRERVDELLEQAARLGPAGMPPGEVDLATLEDQWLIGTPDEVIARIEEYRALGISHFMLWFMDFPNMEGIRLFAETVIPRFKVQTAPSTND
jgi:alkanesulfonate monooxygenase SsuD/methylene tetrahydromethanopterin reductase-like flavin-dependent oxidoreductase (luciferase family)